MKSVCSNFHTSSYVENFYVQYDGVVNLYNEKFGKPATAIYKKIRSLGLISSDITFDDELEWTYFYFWHHEGRRARMGAAMFAPDYTQWHGFFEVAERFYVHFIPQVEELIDHAMAEEGEKAVAAEEVKKLIEEILSRDDHVWFTGKDSEAIKAARKKAAAELRKRYSE